MLAVHVLFMNRLRGTCCALARGRDEKSPSGHHGAAVLADELGLRVEIILHDTGRAALWALPSKAGHVSLPTNL